MATPAPETVWTHRAPPRRAFASYALPSGYSRTALGLGGWQHA